MHLFLRHLQFQTSPGSVIHVIDYCVCKVFLFFLYVILQTGQMITTKRMRDLEERFYQDIVQRATKTRAAKPQPDATQSVPPYHLVSWHQAQETKADSSSSSDGTVVYCINRVREWNVWLLAHFLHNWVMAGYTRPIISRALKQKMKASQSRIEIAAHRSEYAVLGLDLIRKFQLLQIGNCFPICQKYYSRPSTLRPPTGPGKCGLILQVVLK